MNGLGDDSALNRVCPRRCKNLTLKNKAAFLANKTVLKSKERSSGCIFAYSYFASQSNAFSFMVHLVNFLRHCRAGKILMEGNKAAPEFFTRIFHQKFPRFAKYGSRSITGVTKQNIQSKMFL